MPTAWLMRDGPTPLVAKGEPTESAPVSIPANDNARRIPRTLAIVVGVGFVQGVIAGLTWREGSPWTATAFIASGAWALWMNRRWVTGQS